MCKSKAKTIRCLEGPPRLVSGRLYIAASDFCSSLEVVRLFLPSHLVSAID
jgi:hypothetical protein